MLLCSAKSQFGVVGIAAWAAMVRVGCRPGVVVFEESEQVAGDVALEATSDFGSALAAGGAPGDVVDGSRVDP